MHLHFPSPESRPSANQPILISTFSLHKPRPIPSCKVTVNLTIDFVSIYIGSQAKRRTDDSPPPPNPPGKSSPAAHADRRCGATVRQLQTVQYLLSHILHSLTTTKTYGGSSGQKSSWIINFRCMLTTTSSARTPRPISTNAPADPIWRYPDKPIR